MGFACRAHCFKNMALNIRCLPSNVPRGLLRGSSRSKATLKQTFTEMADFQENWEELETASADGLDKLVW